MQEDMNVDKIFSFSIWSTTLESLNTLQANLNNFFLLLVERLKVKLGPSPKCECTAGKIL